jgi:CubicO group peptidase (beta-lactamase class C family)
MTRGAVLGVVLAIVFVGGCATTPPLPAPSPGPSPVTMRLTDYVDSLTTAQRFRGAVEVRLADRVLLSRGFGDADVSKGIANGPRTRFRINSVTKQFTALTILKLQEKGKLKTSDPVCAHLPRCPQAWSAITIEHALTHTAGLFADFSLAEVDAYLAKIHATRPTAEQLVGLFADRPLEFAPGSRYKYSNSGYHLLGYLIEQVTGKDYGTVLRQEIFDPLGMADSGLLPEPADQHPTATGYDTWTTPTDAAFLSLDAVFIYAAGGIYSTTTDLARWNQFLLTDNPPIVGKDTLSQLFRPRVQADTASQYGYGLHIGGTPDKPTYFHSGEGPGFTSYAEIRPATQLSIVILSNLRNAETGRFGEVLANLAE